MKDIHMCYEPPTCKYKVQTFIISQVTIENIKLGDKQMHLFREMRAQEKIARASSFTREGKLGAEHSRRAGDKSGYTNKDLGCRTASLG